MLDDRMPAIAEAYWRTTLEIAILIGVDEHMSEQTVSLPKSAMLR